MNDGNQWMALQLCANLPFINLALEFTCQRVRRRELAGPLVAWATYSAGVCSLAARFSACLDDSWDCQGVGTIHTIMQLSLDLLHQASAARVGQIVVPGN